MKRMNRIMIMIGAIALILFVPAAYGQTDDSEAINPFIENLDTNNDGVISLEEFTARNSEVFIRWDRNGDGQIDQTDLSTRRRGFGRRGARFLGHLDTSGDGIITEAEFSAGSQERFNRLDQDGDGVINSDETPRPRLRMGGMGGGFMARWDTNGDGQVTSDEFSGPDEHFTQLDQDGNGIIDESEAPAPIHRHGRMRGDMIGHLDKDSDGKISKDEFPSPDEHFTQLDVNSDGYIDESELPGPGVGRANRAERMIDRWDADDSGTISQDEFMTGYTDRFNKLDQNDDGQIDGAEIPANKPRFGNWGSGPNNALRFGPGRMYHPGRNWR